MISDETSDQGLVAFRGAARPTHAPGKHNETSGNSLAQNRTSPPRCSARVPAGPRPPRLPNRQFIAETSKYVA